MRKFLTTLMGVVMLLGWAVPDCLADTIWESDFASTKLTGYTVINNSGNATTWHKDNMNECKDYEVYIDTDQSKKSNDWLITPGIELIGGNTYKLEFAARCKSNGYPESMNVYFGTSNTVSGMTNTIATLLSITAELPYQAGNEFQFTPETDGTYYIGFQCTSSKGMWYLYLGNIKVSGDTSGGGGDEPDPEPVAGVDVPWDAEFTSNLKGFTIENGNDSMTWAYDSSRQCPIIHSWNYDTQAHDLDDWLITPGINMVAGQAYDIEYFAASINNDNDWMDVAIGKQAKSVALNTVLLENQAIPKDGKKYFHTYIPEEDGVYFIGFHATGYNHYSLYIEEISVKEAVAGAAAPKQVTNVELKAGTEDDSEAWALTYSFTTPTQDVTGMDITNNLKVEIYEYSNLRYTKEDVAPGEEVVWTRELYNDGWYGEGTKIIVYNGDKASEAYVVSESCFVGHVAPAAPQNVTAVATENPGELKATWSAVTTNANGKPFAEDATVTYNVYKVVNGNETLVAEGLTDTEYTFNALENGGKATVSVRVKANDGLATGEAGNSAGVFFSLPYGVPYTATISQNLEDTGFTVINGGDATTWGYSSDKGGAYAIYSYQSSKHYQLDDWLFTPGVKMEAGKVYEIKYAAWSSSDYEGHYESMGVAIGKATTVAGMSNILLENQEIAQTGGINWDKRFYSHTFCPEETGVYYLGFHATTYDISSLYVNEITINEVDLSYGKALAPVVTAANDENGNVVLSWTPVAKNEFDVDVTPDRYVINRKVGSDWLHVYNVVPSEDEALTYTYSADEPCFQQFQVYAVCGDVQGMAAETETIVCGAPVANFHETYNNYVFSYPWDIKGAGIKQEGWYLNDNCTAFDFRNQNGNNATVEMKSVLIAVPEQSPKLSFMIERWDDKSINYDVYVREAGKAEFVKLNDEFISANELAENTYSWYSVLVDLDEYAGKAIQLCIAADIESGGHAVFGNILVGSLTPAELTIESLDYTENAKAGNREYVNLVVKNNGKLNATNVDAVLYKEGEEDDPVEHDSLYGSLSGGEETEFSIQIDHSALEETNALYYVVVYWGDGEETRSESFRITSKFNKFATASDLKGVATYDSEEENANYLGYKLTWQYAPVEHSWLQQGPVYVTAYSDDAEDGEEDVEDPTVGDETEESGEILGYNVYKNGQQIGWNVKDNSFVDSDAQEGEKHVYAVSAVYENGHSAPVFHETGVITAVESVAADETEAVYYTLDGIRVNKQNLVPGIYVVVKNGKAVKVTVK